MGSGEAQWSFDLHAAVQLLSMGIETERDSEDSAQPHLSMHSLYQIQGWQTGSGHMLVDVDLDGQHAGLMILDTGASGFVVEQRVADDLHLERFGELHIAGITGKVCAAAA